jgi:pantoate--beta-alanine ligase
MSASVAATIAECRAAVSAARRAGHRIGFVPTMGALHEGHLSLVDRAREAAGFVVLSIFVNPLQFGPADDFAAYPRDLERDSRLAGERGAALVFAPSVTEMYPSPFVTRVTMREVTEEFEGAARPGHFDGVLTVVAKLFLIVQPDVAVFGQKDAQQAAAVRRLVVDLDFPIEIIVAPTVREADGVACSSRNNFLSEAERRKARGLHRALTRARELADGGETDARRIEAAMRDVLARVPALDVEYAAIVDRDHFQPLERIEVPAVAVVAARVGRTRLIDNVVLEADGA